MRKIIDGKEYFPATQCAKIIGHQNPARAVRKYCKGVTKIDTPTDGGIQEVNFIAEGDLYRLIVHSRTPESERFERWVFDEVLPTIRQTGEYEIKSTKDKYISEIDIAKAELSLVEVTAKLLNLNDSSKLALATNIYENHNIPTNLLPQYTKSKDRILPVSDLLKKNYINMSAIAFNKKISYLL